MPKPITSLKTTDERTRVDVATRSRPFDVKVPNEETLAAMKQARRNARARFGSAKDLIDELDKKTAKRLMNRAAT